MEPPLPQLPGVEHRHVAIHGLRVHVAEAGQGEPLVLQHGWPQHWWMWRELIGPLAQRYRVICPDLRGFGWSTAPRGGYEKMQLARDLLALLDALDIERTRLMGHDWGAWLGFLACIEAPERFSRFLALSVPHPWELRGASDPRQLARAWYQLVIAAPVTGPLAVGRLRFGRAILTRARALGSYLPEELEVYEQVLRRRATAKASAQMYRTFLTREIVPIARGSLDTARLRVPTRLMIGERDLVGKDVGDSFRAHADDMELEFVPGAGHFLPEETPDLVLDRALAFFG